MCFGTYPQRPSFSVLKHSKHTLLQLHCSIELGQVIIVNLLELHRREMRSQTTSVTSEHHTNSHTTQGFYRVEFNLLGLVEISIRVFQLFQDHDLQQRHTFVQGFTQPRLLTWKIRFSHLLVIESTLNLEIGLFPFIFNLIKANKDKLIKASNKQSLICPVCLIF